MKKLFAMSTERRWSTGVVKTAFVFFIGVSLGTGFWFASMPMADGQTKLTPVEMIQSKLPQGKTIATATDTELLDAMCRAVKQWAKDAPLLVRTAAGARKNLRADILCMAIRCLREKHTLDCAWVTDVVREWIKADPGMANQLTELVSNCAPECRDALQGLGGGEGTFANPPTNVNPPPGSSGGGASENICIVCHNGQNIQISCSDLDGFLRSHPGDTAGPCQVTPSTNP